MIEAALFDFGGVLVEGGRHGAMNRAFADLLGVDQADLQLDDLHRQFRCGLISSVDFFAELNRRHPDSPNIDARAFIASFSDLYMTRVDELYDLAAALRRAGIKTGLLSNIYEISADWLGEHGYYDGFDPVILSCDEKAAKPDPAIYHSAVRKLGVRPDEILFIDDQEKCLPPARRLGMYAILAESPGQVIRDTLALLRIENGLNLGG